MANLQDFYTTGVGNAANDPAPGPAMNSAGSPPSGAELGKDIVVAWAVLFAALVGMNIVIRKFGKVV